ncbi:hypothetical protein [Allosphingosinicella sp.]|jgi:hypothetical protein|uniref:hypothetical protein n=1 Tax=Allosphingosinicella sp. TaxID=2823234 RepID=UPI002EEAA7BE
MKSIGSLLLSIVVAVIVIWLAIKLLGAALKLVAILIGIGIALLVFFVVRGMIDGGGGRA